MKFSLSSEPGDRLFTILAVGLALTSGAFGGLMVVRLERMENPPVLMGIDFSSLQEDAGAAADPIRTGTIVRSRPSPRSTGYRSARHGNTASLEFRLLSVVDGVAFIEVAGPDGRQLWPVDVGSELPGAGRVMRIERNDNGWSIHTPVITITGQR
jgi:hypothetical protein